MLRRIFLLLIALSFTAHALFAQNKGELTQSRILILLDGSSSMVESWEKNTARFKAASEVIMKLMDSVYQVNDQVEFSLRVFGHQYSVPENNCYDTKNEVPFSKDNRTQMALRLADIHPSGITPIAYALRRAAEEDLVDEVHNAYSIVLITDGGESCGGDICEVVKTLLARKVYFKPYVVSLVDYAPLKGEYACMGDYLQVTASKDIPRAIGTIVEAYTPMLKISKSEYKQIQSIIANPPSVLKVSIPSVKVPENTAPKQAPPVVIAPPKVTKVIKEPKKEPVVIKEVPKPAPVAPRPSHIAVGDANERKDEKIAKLQIAKTHTLHQLYLLGQEKIYMPVRVPPFPTIKAEQQPARQEAFHSNSDVMDAPPQKIPMVVTTKKPVTKPIPPKPVTKPAPRPAKPEPLVNLIVTQETLPAKETTVEIYFTDGHGKFYQTTPEINLFELGSGALVKKFYRTVDSKGNPDPRTDIPVGMYDLTITNKKATAHNIKVEPNKLNKINVIVSGGSLRFTYEGNPNRPVKEFHAVVIQRNMPNGKVVEQSCTQVLPYEPGNYSIQINTLPADIRNTDLDIVSETEIRLPEPGFIQFTNQSAIGNVTLYKAIGDQFGKFYTLKVSGNINEQKVMLQPGPYQARFVKNPKAISPQETIVLFNVKSNETTEAELK